MQRVLVLAALASLLSAAPAWPDFVLSSPSPPDPAGVTAGPPSDIPIVPRFGPGLRLWPASLTVSAARCPSASPYDRSSLPPSTSPIVLTSTPAHPSTGPAAPLGTRSSARPSNLLA